MLEDEAIFSKEQLQKLNLKLEMIQKQFDEKNIDTSLFKKIFGVLINSLSCFNNGRIYKISPIKKEQLLSKSLEFFESLDDDIYKTAINIVLQQNPNIILNMYDVKKLTKEDFKKKNEFGIEKYSRCGLNMHGYARSSIYVPYRAELKTKEEQKMLDENFATINDLYVMTHEISHLFNLDLKNETYDAYTFVDNEPKRKFNLAGEIFSETTSFAIEEMLTEHLLSGKEFSKDSILQIEIFRNNYSLLYAKIFNLALQLLEEKKNNGNITNKYLKSLVDNKNYYNVDIKNYTNEIIRNSDSIKNIRRYAMGLVTSPTITRSYIENKTNGIKNFKEYCEKVKENKFEEALSVYDIDFKSDGIDKLLQNFKWYQNRIRNIKEKSTNEYDSI